MLERYFVRPSTVDRIRASWLGGPIEQYVTWLGEGDCSRRCVHARVPTLVRFGEFTRERGATSVEDLPRYVEEFVDAWIGNRKAGREARPGYAKEIRGPVEQMLRVIIPGFRGRVGLGPRGGRVPVKCPGFLPTCARSVGSAPCRSIITTTISRASRHTSVESICVSSSRCRLRSSAPS